MSADELRLLFATSVCYLKDGRAIDLTHLTAIEAIDKLRALGVRLEDIDRTEHVSARVVDLTPIVEAKHAEQYPVGCPPMCEACTKRLAAVHGFTDADIRDWDGRR